MVKNFNVVVIGAAMSGLTAVKSCLEENLDVICYEKTNCIGGNWVFRENGQSCMKTTTLNVSKELMAYSDFPFKPETPNFIACHKFVDYLKDYATEFGLLPCVRVSHEVVSVEEGPEFRKRGNWKVTVFNLENGKHEIVHADNVMVCIGYFVEPHIPKLAGLDTFEGQIIHSVQYKTPNGLEDKNVLIIGQGNSAYDVAVELGNVAKNVYCIRKPGVLVFPRMGKDGYPYDKYFTRFNLNKWMYWSSDNQIAMHFLSTRIHDLDLYGLPIDEYRIGEHLPSINDFLPFSILSGKVQIMPPIKSFTAKGVIFENKDEEIPIDVIVLSTGFMIPSYQFFPPGKFRQDDFIDGLYKRVFPIKLEHQTLAFIGSGRYLGSMAGLSEMQSRWAAMVFSKNISLPPKSVQEMETKSLYSNPMYSKFKAEGRSPNYFPLPYLDEIARFIGAKPNFFTMFFTDPKLFRACMFGPLVLYQYRLIGQHSWARARETILTVTDRMKSGLPNLPKKSKNKYKVISTLTILAIVTGTSLYVYKQKF